MIRRIVPLLAHFSPQQSVFREALEWGSRLHLPIHALCLQSEGKPANHDEQACAEACARLAVPWELRHHSSAVRHGFADFLRPDDLLLLAQRPEPAEKSFVLCWAGGRNGPALGVCPDTFSPLTRILYVQRDARPSEIAIATVVELCRELGFPLVVLSLAGSEREAWQQQRLAEEMVAAHRYPADFDSLVGWDLRSAVVRVAGWRRCTHVILERQSASSWWRWLGADPTERLLDLSVPLTFLTLPEVGSPSRIALAAAR
jgi:hypothetical protein